MEESREGDCRVPLISAIFCICLATGGVLLGIYVFSPSVSEPWFPVVAFVMIGIPWMFWFVTYIYACTKVCFRRGNLKERQISRRNLGVQSRNAAALSARNTMGRKPSISQEPPVENNSSKDGKHVQFAEVIVLDGESERKTERGDSGSVASSTESEMPLNVGASSS